MKVSDYILEYIKKLGVEHVFCVTGGGAMHMNDSLGRCEGVEGVFMLHEQGAAIAAEAYARARDGYGVCLVTSGPGATNALTGLAGAYMDSIPVLFISGQVKRADLRDKEGVRQFGIQEVDIISMATSYSKYAVQIKEPEDICYEMEKAAALAKSGRPGPVWIDVPLDIQASEIELENVRHFDANLVNDFPVRQKDLDKVIEAFNNSKRPVILLGHGIRLSNGISEARKLYETVGVPVLTSWNGVDLIEEDNPLYFGRPGAIGSRHANFIMQNADMVLTIGTRLNLLATGYNFESFLENATHIMVDIDEAEMNKKSVHPDIKVVCDAKSFLNGMLERVNEIEKKDRSSWLKHCNELKEKYPLEIPEIAAREGYVSNYHLIEEISKQMNSDDNYQFTSSGTTIDIAMKTFKIKWGQRAFLTKGLAAMGYDIPASIGNCMGSGRRVICVTGDGSACMNMQELEVIKRLNLPIKLFVADNSGYSMIYGSQNGNFKGRLTGCTKESGLTLPNFERLAKAFGIKAMHIEDEKKLAKQVKRALDFDGPVVCTTHADILQKILPKQTNYMREDGQMASRPLEDMSPLLERDEFEKAMHYGE